MNKDFTLETKDEIKRDIDHQVIRLATELKESIEDNFTKANEKIIIQQVLINTLEDRIDKAIEHIENLETEYESLSYGIVDYYKKELLDILKGSDSNE